MVNCYKGAWDKNNLKRASVDEALEPLWICVLFIILTSPKMLVSCSTYFFFQPVANKNQVDFILL